MSVIPLARRCQRIIRGEVKMCDCTCHGSYKTSSLLAYLYRDRVSKLASARCELAAVSARFIIFMLHQRRIVKCCLLMYSQALHKLESRVALAPTISYRTSTRLQLLHVIISILYLVLMTLARYARVETGTPYESANKPSARISRYAIVWGMSCQVSSNRIKTYQGGIQSSNIRANGL